MTTPQQEKSKAEVCSIRIIFPVQSDEQALECKKKISEALSDITDVQIQFSIMTPPSGMGMPQSRL